MGGCSGVERKRKKIINNNMDAPEPIKIFPSPKGDLDINISSDNKNMKPKIAIDSPLPEVEKLNTKGNSIITVDSPFPEFRELNTKGNNIIKMKINICKNDVNKPTKILYNLKKVISGCNLDELNESNTELFINNKKYKYKSYFIPEKEGIHDIQLNIKILMKNCCCLFYGLTNLLKIDLSSFNTSDVTNMSYMFYDCSNVQSLDLSSFNTENAISMSCMFYGCSKLNNIFFSSSRTNKLTDMSYMFYGCSNVQSLDLSSFNTENVFNMNYMFFDCSNVQSLDLSSFNTKNVRCHYDIYCRCERLERVILSFEARDIALSDKTFFA